MRWFVVWLALLAALAGAPAAAQGFPPRPDGPVHDGANIIPDTDEALLDARLREYNTRTGRALIVATVPSLGNETIETYAETLFNDEWGIGGAGTDQGLLLLVAPAERKVRIETGYGLQEYVTDILSGRIIRDEITPRFKAGDFAGGINAGVDALIAQLDRDPASAEAIAEAAAAAERQRGGDQEGFPFGVLVWLGFMFFFFILPAIGAARGGRRYRGDRDGGVAGAVGNVILWSAINAAANSGRDSGGGGWGGGGFGGFGGGGGFGGFGGGMSGGGGASGSW